MAAQNRHLRGDKEEVLASVKGSTVIEAGDFLFRNSIDGLVGTGVAGGAIAADNTVYPFDYAMNSASETCTIVAGIHTNFLGVAMESSPSGSTENISVATAGVFRYPMYRNSAVTIGSKISAVSTFTAASSAGVSPQSVYHIATTPGTTAYLGYITKTESGASYVEFRIRTAFGSGALITS